jgi:SWI/SNF-related matrix-associated actin-dependent regulator of chromatin subfamily A member 5
VTVEHGMDVETMDAEVIDDRDDDVMDLEPEPNMGDGGGGEDARASGSRRRDPSFDEIPADVLADALGARRSGRKTKARVIMIDGEPVLRSNNYSLTEGEPSVFDKELDEERETTDGIRTQYVFEQKKERKTYVRRKPIEPKVQTDNEVKCVNNNREVSKAMEAAVGKKAKYLDTQMKALEPFITPQVKNLIHERAAAHEASQKGPEKVLLPVDNQPKMIKAVLREYQLEGLRWNVRMYDQGTACNREQN